MRLRTVGEHVLSGLLTGLIMFLALLGTANCAEVDWAKPAGIYAASVGADYASTRYALSRGAREVNPMLQGRNLDALKALQFAALVAVDVELQRRGHKGKARALRIGAAVLGAGLAVHNLNVARRQR